MEIADSKVDVGIEVGVDGELTSALQTKNPRQQAAQSIAWLWSKKFKDWKIMSISSIVMGWR